MRLLMGELVASGNWCLVVEAVAALENWPASQERFEVCTALPFQVPSLQLPYA